MTNTGKHKNNFKSFADRLLLSFRRYEAEKYNDGMEESWHVVNNRIKFVKRRRRIYLTLSVASSILLLIGSALIWSTYHKAEEAIAIEVLAENFSEGNIDDNEIILVTSEQEKINIENNSSISYDQEGNLVTHSGSVSDSASKEEKVSYNQILIPKGKHLHVYFSDGSHMYANSGTRVTYPSTFAKDKREIYVDGEIYIDVTRDEARPFFVKTKDMDIKVLGTTFNVCAYREDGTSSVVLVNGKVEVSTQSKQKTILQPDHMFLMKGADIKVRKVDVDEYICWTQNMMIFKNEPLNNILDRLSRYYGQKISYPPIVENMFVSGKIDLRDTMSDVMDIITSFAPVSYSVIDNNIIVKTKDDEKH